MSKQMFTVNNWTPVAVADATNFTNNGYAALQNGTSDTNSLTLVQEIMIQGGAAASAVNNMFFARDSTLGATLAALTTPNSAGPNYPNARPFAANQTPVGFISATTVPQRSSSVSVAKLPLTLNTFGGIIRWQAAPGYPQGEEWAIFGTGTTNAESSISSFTGTGAVTSTIIYEAA
jgi:hypothetical protein